MSRDILEYEMHSGLLFAEEKKVTRTEMIDLLIGAKDSVFTVVYNTKPDDKYLKSILDSSSQKDQSDPKKVKEIAQQLMSGEEKEMTCHMTTSDGKLGRVMALDLNAKAGMNWR